MKAPTWLEPDVAEAARRLIGFHLTNGVQRARIVETEAYSAADDAASHAFRGKTPRNAIMFGPAGFAYVYFSYGNHWMLNVTALASGEAGAVLLRAAEPLAGVEDMMLRRKMTRDQDLLSGPGKLCQAFGITGADNGLNLFDPKSPLHLVEGEPPAKIVAAPRVGIAHGKDHGRLWRFVDADARRWISKPVPAVMGG